MNTSRQIGLATFTPAVGGRIVTLDRLKLREKFWARSAMFAASSIIINQEVLAQLVLAAVFKTVEPHGNHVVGGFDSHAFPPLILSRPISFS
jgi:hypothetical protein